MQGPGRAHGPVRALLTAVLALTLVGGLGGALPARAAGGGQSLSQLQQELNQDQQALNQAKSRLSQIHGAYQRAKQQLYVLEAELNTTRSHITYLSAEVTATEGALVVTQAKYQATKAKLASGRAQVTTALQSLQEQGMGGFLSVLLQAQSFSDFLTRLQEVQTLIQADLGVINQMRIAEENLAMLGSQLTAQKQQLTSLLQEASAQETQLAQEQGQVQVQVSALIQAQGQQQRVVGADEANQAAVTAAITALEGPGTGQGINSIHFIWPVNGPITNPFAYWYDPFAHKWELHTGIDIGVPMYTPIHAAAAGTVIIAGWINGYGNVVVLDNGGGVSTLYAHQSRIEVHVGETVTQGQVIGLVGMTGWATGPHVHFEIRVDGVPKNPVLYLPKR